MKNYDTRQRDLLVDFLEQHPGSAALCAADRPGAARTADQSQRRLSESFPVETKGLIRKSMKSGGRAAYYQYIGTPDCHSHLHMTCTCCGKTFHMNSEHTARLTRAMAELDGFDLDILNTVLYGTCQSCHQK